MRHVLTRVAHVGRTAAAVAVITGLLLGIALGLMLAAGLFAAAVIAVCAVGLSVVVARAVEGGTDRGFVVRAIVLAFSVRAAVAAVLFTAATALGRGGSVTGDDAAYADLSWAFVQWLRGEPQWPDIPPTWNGQDYLFGTFVYLESALFLVIGRDMLAMQMVNAALAAVCYAVLFDVARRLFGSPPARLTLAIVAVYPSLVLWSSLNLKEAYIVLAVTAVLGVLLRIGARPSVMALVLSYAAIESLQSLRSFSFVGLVLIVPIGLVLVRSFRPLQRLRWTVASIAASAVLLSLSPWGPFATDLRYALENIEITRRSQAEFARTGFTDPRPIAVSMGETLYVPPPPAPSETPEPTPDETPPPAASGPVRTAPPRPSPTPRPPPTCSPSFRPALYYVRPGTKLTLGDPRLPTPTGGPTRFGDLTVGSVIVVRELEVTVGPCDIVVIGEPTSTPAPEVSSRKLFFLDQRAGGQSATVDLARSEPEQLLLNRTLEHLPVGLSYAFFAPFPWAVRRLTEAALLPEMLLWYLFLPCAVRTLWVARGDWRRLTPTVLYVGGVFFLFGLLEGNVGTLYRHRAMLVPYVAMLAAPSLIALGRRAATWRDSGRSAAHPPPRRP